MQGRKQLFPFDVVTGGRALRTPEPATLLSITYEDQTPAHWDGTRSSTGNGLNGGAATQRDSRAERPTRPNATEAIDTSSDTRAPEARLGWDDDDAAATNVLQTHHLPPAVKAAAPAATTTPAPTVGPRGEGLDWDLDESSTEMWSIRRLAGGTANVTPTTPAPLPAPSQAQANPASGLQRHSAATTTVPGRRAPSKTAAAAAPAQAPSAHRGSIAPPPPPPRRNTPMPAPNEPLPGRTQFLAQPSAAAKREEEHVGSPGTELEFAL